MIMSSGQGVVRPSEPGRTNGNSHELTNALLRKILDLMDFLPVCFVLWDGQEVAPSTAMPVARIRIHDRDALLRIIANPDLQFGEMYSAGRIDVEGKLLEVVEALYRARSGFAPGGLRKALLKWVTRSDSNPIGQGLPW